MKKTTLILVLMVLVVGSTSQALIEKSPFWNLIGDWLTYSGNVKIEGNVSIDGNYVNITVVNYNVTGDFAVDGNVSADYFLGNGSLMNSNIWNESGANVYCANNDCNVGIGTTTPSAKLVVGGAAIFGSSPGAANDLIINPDYGGSGDLLAGTYIGGNSNAGNLNIIPTATGAEGTILSLGYYTGAVWESALQISNTAGGVFGNLTLMKDGGNVGIGTASPASTLDSTGTIRAIAGTQSAPSSGTGLEMFYTTSGGNDWGVLLAYDRTGSAYKPIRFDGSNYSFYTSGGTADVTIDSTGNVGIGTDTPLAKLNVDGDLRVGYTGDRIQMDNLVANKMRVKSFSASLQLGSGYDGIYFTDSSDATVMRIQDDGNIGIGTTTPGTNLQVSGGANAVAYSSSSSSTAAPWAIDNGTTVSIKSDKASVDNSAAYLGLASKTSGSQTTISYIGNIAGTGTASDMVGNAMVFGFRTDGATNYDERMRLTNEGNVGIGTTTPSEKLEVIGNFSVTGEYAGGTADVAQDMANYYDVNGVLRSSLDVGGRQTWYVSTTAAEAGRIVYATPGGQPGIVFFDEDGTDRSDFALIAGGGFSWGASTASTLPPTLMTLKTGGDLAVDTNTLYVDASENSVGIGTTSPSEVLDVAGNIMVNTNKFKTTRWAMYDKPGYGDGISIRNHADTAWGDVNQNSIRVFGDIYFQTNANSIKGQASPDFYYDFEARKTDATAAYKTLLRMQNAATDPYIGLGGSQEFKFYETGYMTFPGGGTIDISGNVGIGTTTPSHKLNVVGKMNVTNNVILGGNFTLIDTVFDDLRFPASIIKTVGASNLPDWDATNFGYLFDAGTMEQAYIIAQTPHGRKSGTDIYPHFHWSPTSTNTGNVSWCLEYTWAGINETFPTKSDACVLSQALGTTNQHIQTNDIIINGIGKNISTVFKARIFRNATAVSDTYTGDALLNEFDIHVEIHEIGTNVRGDLI